MRHAVERGGAACRRTFFENDCALNSLVGHAQGPRIHSLFPKTYGAYLRSGSLPAAMLPVKLVGPGVCGRGIPAAAKGLEALAPLPVGRGIARSSPTALSPPPPSSVLSSGLIFAHLPMLEARDAEVVGTCSSSVSER